MPKKTPKVSDFRPQAENANGHTQRGLGLLSKSLDRNKWFGAMTATADLEVIDGSARLEEIYNKLGDSDLDIVYSDGSKPVVVVRTDIPNADDPRAKELSVAANRVAETSLNWQLDVLENWKDEGIAIDEYFRDDELAKLTPPPDNLDELEEEMAREPVDGEKYPLAVVLSWAELQEWKVIKESLGVKSDRDGFLKLMKG